MAAVICIPTYQEVDGIAAILGRTLTAVPGADIRVIDDSSPDGTAGVVQRIARVDRRVHLLMRPGKLGLGAAYRAGFDWALDRGYDQIVEMDADGSHRPEQLPELLAGLAEADVVLGSRWIPGGRTIGWPLRRIQAATGVRRETASAYLKAAGIPVRLPRRRRAPAPKPASQVSTDFGGLSGPEPLPPRWPPPTSRAPTASACEPYRELIEQALARGRNAMAIWQDLVDQHGFPGRYASVRRYVVKLRGADPPEAHPVIVTAPGEEG